MNALFHTSVTLLMSDGDAACRISVFVCQVSAQVLFFCARISSQKPLIRF